MQVDGPGTQLTAAGVAELGRTQPGQQGTEKDHGPPHLPHEPVGDVPAGEVGGVHPDGSSLLADLTAQQTQDVQGVFHVGQAGAVVNDAFAGDQDSGGQNGKNAVLGPLDGQPAFQRPPAGDFIEAHG